MARAAALVVVGALEGFRTAYGASAPSVLDSERLKLELRVTTREQAAYVEDVVKKAKAGTLPPKILVAAYRYAMRYEASRRPLYFKLCLETLAKRAGLRLKFLSF
jgi:hypothetical protein